MKQTTLATFLSLLGFNSMNFWEKVDLKEMGLTAWPYMVYTKIIIIILIILLRLFCTRSIYN